MVRWLKNRRVFNEIEDLKQYIYKTNEGLCKDLIWNCFIHSVFWHIWNIWKK